MAKETLASMLDDFINEQLDQIVLSNPAEKDHLLKVKVRPMLMKGALVFQAEEFTKTQAFHKNMSAEELQEKLQHNRQKRYVIPEGHAVPFLVDLGVQTPDGKVIKSRYDKFRQINRFLEFIEDILPKLDKNREM